MGRTASTRRSTRRPLVGAALALAALAATGCDPGTVSTSTTSTSIPVTTTSGGSPTTVVPSSTSTTRAPATTSTLGPTTSTTARPPTASGQWLMGYYPLYQRDLMPAAEVPWSGLTHLVVGRVVPAADGSLDTTFDVGSDGPAAAKDLGSRAHANRVSPILMVGGAGTYDGFAAAARSARPALVRNLVAQMRSLGYDGLDLDLEPIQSADQAPLLALVADLRAAAPGIVLTVPVGWTSVTFADVDAFYGRLSAGVDRINLMSYGMAGAWDGWRTWHSSALDGAGASTPSSVAVSVASYLRAGVPAAKLGVGIGFYGSCWAGGATGPNQALGSSRLVADDNTMSFTNIMASYWTSAAYRYDSAAEAPYLSFASPRGPQRCTYVSYEDQRSVTAKGAYSRRNGLGGAIVWTINQAHDRAQPAGRRDALLDAAASAFLGR